MPNQQSALIAEVARLKRELAQVKKGQRIAHGASIENAAVEVRDDTGSLRAIVGQQSDGTTAVNVVNGPLPPRPSPPIVEPALAALMVSWNGTFEDAVAAPLDWMRCEVHIGATAGFTPDQVTLRDTIESTQGGIVTIPLPYTEWYVKLRSRTSSGTASAATTAIAATPRKAETQDLTAGIITAELIAVDALTGKTITGGTITGAVLQTAATGPRVSINEASSNGLKVEDGTREVVALDASGLELTGSSGASLTLDPNSLYPTIFLSSENGTNSAYINVVADTPGDANLGLNCGPFTADSQVMRWRQYFGNDFFVAERFLDSDPAVLLGGRMDLRKDFAAFGYYDTDGATQSADLVITPGLAQIQGRLSVQPTLGDSSSVIFAQSGTGHTGFLLRLYNTAATAYRFQVDLAGNTNISGILTAANRAQGTTNITPSAAHTPTSMLVTYNVVGTTFRGYATAQTTVPGVRTPVGAQGVTGVSVSSVTATSMLVWVNRENTTATNVNWSVEAS